VLVFDLVTHSKRGKAAIYSIQAELKNAFSRTIAELGTKDVYFNYTGDGYVCTLFGDSSARLMDFINASVPRLLEVLQPYKQDFRVGVDFGLVHVSQNALTGGQEHFDLPGIQAARLEAAAVSGQILCTQTVHGIFAQHYPEMFSKDAKAVKTKDREILAYQLTPIDTRHVQEFFSRYLFRTGGWEHYKDMGSRAKILLVDDDLGIVEVLKDMLSSILPKYRIVTALSGEEALKSFEPGAYAAVVTDIRMPGINGVELTKRILALDPEQIVIAVTGYHSEDVAKESLGAGASWYLSKPFRMEELSAIIQLAFAFGSPLAIRNRIKFLWDNPGEFMWHLQLTSNYLHGILAQVGEVSDPAHTLLRHKAKNIVRDFVDSLKPGCRPVDLLSTVNQQLNCIDRLSRIVSRMTGSEFKQHLEQLCDDLKEENPNIEFQVTSFDHAQFEKSIPLATTLMLVIAELLDNAISAIGDSGRIEIRVSYLKTTGVLHVRVRDTGPGIPKEIADKIFQEGLSTKGIGRGQGLALVRTAVESLHGEIEYSSTDGTTFHVKFPLPY